MTNHIRLINVVDLSTMKEDKIFVGGSWKDKVEFVAMLKSKGFEGTARRISGEPEPEKKTLNELLKTEDSGESISTGKEEVNIANYDTIERFVVGVLTDEKTGYKTVEEIERLAADAKLNDDKSIMWLNRQVAHAIAKMKKDGFCFATLRSKAGKKMIVKGTRAVERDEKEEYTF